MIKKILIVTLLLAVLGAVVYWYVASEKFEDTATVKPDIAVSATEFIREFNQDDSAANARYRDKIVAVNGVVSEKESVDTSRANIKFIDAESGSYVIFDFQEKDARDANTLQPGDNVTIKGSCSGSIFSEILGTQSITFKRCTLVR